MSSDIVLAEGNAIYFFPFWRDSWRGSLSRHNGRSAGGVHQNQISRINFHLQRDTFNDFAISSRAVKQMDGFSGIIPTPRTVRYIRGGIREGSARREGMFPGLKRRRVGDVVKFRAQ